MYNDEIHIKRLKCFAYHGVHEEEKVNGQNFFVSVILHNDTSCIGQYDDLNFTTNYGEVADFIYKTMTENTYDLIETCAEKIASGILLLFPLVLSVDVEIEKPEAPLGYDFLSVSVKITRRWHKAYIGLGSNLGDSKQTIQSALTQIEKHPKIKDLRSSTLITSKPYGNTDQPHFLNGAAAFLTMQGPHELLDFLQGIESEHGRKRIEVDGEKSVRWGARTLDLDILMYESKPGTALLLQDKRLTIPHPDMENRDFVLVPLAELEPNLVHPIIGCSISDLLFIKKQHSTQQARSGYRIFPHYIHGVPRHPRR